ncbi:OCIA domain-containing protein 1-like [Trichomycterus rosablanca]|uniref:OCIA domain-containing protein 1-like n=1 Tax=Trichomycterus rosablanca TaxID=2290929 RepID=UPI002F351732
MSQSSSDFTERGAESNPGSLGVGYIPTEEEKRVFKECDHESFWYRSVPISASSMALTQLLISRGFLTSSTRFGSLPKVFFAGVCGYFAGKVSYMRTCQEKFLRLENSPLAEALRQRRQHQHPPHLGNVPSDEKPQFGGLVQSDIVTESPYSSSQSSLRYPPQTNEVHDEEEEMQKKPILYDELRSRNRESYDKTHRETLKQEVKKNKYGDQWEE